MKIATLIEKLESWAPTPLQESYDNCGLLVGNYNNICTGVLCNLDVTEEVIDEAIAKNCNLIISHHPLIFSGLKKINGNNSVEKCVIKAIQNNIALYAIHTNLDNIVTGVNSIIAQKIGLVNTTILLPKNNILQKLYTFVPAQYLPKVQEALFNAGAGEIGNYSNCSYYTNGTGTFKANDNTNPFVGKKGEIHFEQEEKLEVIFPAWLQNKVLTALINSHPYEEVAYDIVTLNNDYTQTGSGIIGNLPEPVSEKNFLQHLKQTFDLQVIKHSPLLQKPITKVAVCGGAGSFLIKHAIKAKADIYITADLKYHDYFEHNQKLVIADIGHYESEQFTTMLIINFLQQNFPNFAVLKSEVTTNPVQYFV